MWYVKKKNWMSDQNSSCSKILFQVFSFNKKQPLFIRHYSSLRSVPVTTVRLSTGWGRGVGCRTCGPLAGHRCSFYCGRSVWCCHLTARHSWPSGFASPSFHMVCCSSATPLSPNWRASREREKQEYWGHSGCQNAEVNNYKGREGPAECVKSIKISVSRFSFSQVIFLHVVTIQTIILIH